MRVVYDTPQCLYVLHFSSAEVECELLLCAWKGNHSARLYLSKHERMHSLHLISHPVPDYLLPNKNARRSRADNKPRGDANGEGDGDVPHTEDTSINDDESECTSVVDEDARSNVTEETRIE